MLRGQFTPGRGLEEFCDRRLLARMHRATLDRLRRAIDPVSAQDYMRFLIEWQGLGPGGRFEGRAGLRTAIQRLQGFEAPVAAWESVLLPSRVRDFQPSWLDELCLSGEVAWGRLSQPRPNVDGDAPITGYTLAATRATPITLVPRRDLPLLLAAARSADAAAVSPPTVGAGGEIHRLLEARGALFFDEIATALRRLPTDVEEGLRALIGGGWVASDGFHGVRALAGRRRRGGWRRRGGRHGLSAAASPPGRWSLLAAAPTDEAMADDLAERVAHVMLGRYGVVFRDLRRREAFAVPWREVLRALRRLEARGAVRGGRFVTGFVGEQYALPEAVTALRRHRAEGPNGRRVRISAVDPLNLTGIVTPGERVPAYPGRSIELIDGLPSVEHDAVAR